MKFYAVLAPALLGATVYADDTASKKVEEEPTPVGQLWTARWDAATLKPFTQHCKNRNTYEASIYKLDQLYPDLEEQAPELKVFYNKQLYAGSWGGIDVHGVGRELIKMHMSEMPYKVREWIKLNPKQRHYSVQDDLVFFAPGAIYPILPMWVDDADEGLACEGVFDDLDNYSNEPKDGYVIGKVAHTNTGDKAVKFTVEALQVKSKTAKDEL